MPKFAKPWLRNGRGWYVTLDGRQIPLRTDQDAAFDQYHRLMQQPKEHRQVAPEAVASLIDQFLDWTEKHRAPDTYRWYKDRLQAFVDRYPDLLIGQLKPYHAGLLMSTAKAELEALTDVGSSALFGCSAGTRDRGYYRP